ncbi:MAG: phosphoribosylamine--glycine ligase [Rikenellaceae bacterium]|jgi:phosphoribosylamine--glycine ligase|nr:phosphoribosylamine--glycine ligase [Rikenellaceae bacterium]
MRLPDSVNVLLLGGGGREHTFACKIAQSRRLSKLYIAPGNGGTAELGSNVDLSAANLAVLKCFIVSQHINLVVVGPEEPLVRGVVDQLRDDPDTHLVPVIGPTAKGAALEGSKDFAKAFMMRHNIPTAAYRSFTDVAQGEAFLETLAPPYVLKADGLAAGKGVSIVGTLPEAKSELAAMLGGRFGEAGSRVVIEQYLNGIECSVFVATDGANYKILPVAKDYKRAGEGDTGPNTGGMGAVSPVAFADETFMERVCTRIIKPTIEGLRSEKIDYKGFIFIGLMNVDGDPYVIEYNVRMGDPETEVVLPRVKSDVVELFEAIAYGGLDRYELEISPDTAATVVCVSEGYPGEYAKGSPVTGLADVEKSLVFHAGTTLKGGSPVTSGGRVLAVTSLDATLEGALAKCYESIGRIEYQGKTFRADIGRDLLKYNR